MLIRRFLEPYRSHGRRDARRAFPEVYRKERERFFRISGWIRYLRDEDFLDVRSDYLDFFPRDFLADPLTFLQVHGTSRKIFRLDRGPMTNFKVFELPAFQHGAGSLAVMAKFVSRGKVRMPDSSGKKRIDPLFELKVLEWAQRLRLPAATPLGHGRVGIRHLILYEKISGHTTHDLDIEDVYRRCRNPKLTDDVRAALLRLRPLFERAGIYRKHWRAKDCVFELDQAGNVTRVVPIDWEKCVVDWPRLSRALSSRVQASSRRADAEYLHRHLGLG